MSRSTYRICKTGSRCASLVVLWLALAVCQPVLAGLDDLEALKEARDLEGIAQRLAEAEESELASAAGYRWRAWLAGAEDDSDRARKLAEEGLERWPDDVGLILLNVDYKLAGLSEKGGFSALRAARAAKREMERAIDIDPRHSGARLSLIRYQLNAPGIAGGGAGKAEAHIEALKSFDAGTHHVLKALLAVRDERLEEAAGHFEKAQAENAAAGLQIDYAVTLQRQEAWDRSWQVLQSLVERHPDHGNAWYQLGRHAAESGRNLAEGLAALQHFMTLPRWPEDPPAEAAMWRMGMIHQHAGRLGEARQAWERALEIEPAFEPARKSLDSL